MHYESRLRHCAFVTVLCLCAAAAVAAPSAFASQPVKELHALFDAEWERDLAENPLAATYIGDHRYSDRWPDLSPAGFARRHAGDRAALAALAKIDRSQLPANEQLNYDLFERMYRDRVETYRFKPWAYDIKPREGPQALNENVELMPFATVADYDRWLKRLRTLPAYLDGYAAMLESAARVGRTQPRVIMERVVPQLQSHLVDAAERSPFWKAFEQLPESLPAAERDRILAEARRTIAGDVIPAYRRFERFFRTTYLPLTRTSVGISDTPDGVAYYANRARYFTTTALTPEEIHQTGLREVARIRAEMQKVMDEVGFKGSLTEFFTKLRTDPQFYYATPDELFRAYVVAAKQIEPELPKQFGRLYRTPFGVRAIPATSAPNTTTAYYSGPSIDGKRAGYYYVNLYRPEVRPKYEIEVLTVHESVPGHHLQIALAQEQGALPNFRRFADFTAYIEGWALYSEVLGYDLGLYTDPYSKFGQLTYDMWRAVRLVVDTGLHVKGWSRQQAIDYFKANAAKTEADIINEIDRYISWPGQALGYKIGQLKILELRARAQRDLGARFDIRAFHDAVLETGPVPLDVLDSHLAKWGHSPASQKE